MKYGPDIVAIILAVAFTFCFTAILFLPPKHLQEPAIDALQNLWLVIVGALAGYIAKGIEHRGIHYESSNTPTTDRGQHQDSARRSDTSADRSTDDTNSSGRGNQASENKAVKIDSGIGSGGTRGEEP